MALVTLKTLSQLFCITSFNLDVSDSLLVTRNDLNSLAILSNLHFLSFSLSLSFFFLAIFIFMERFHSFSCPVKIGESLMCFVWHKQRFCLGTVLVALRYAYLNFIILSSRKE